MYHYGDKMELRLLEEIWFWSMQGREHATVLKELIDIEDRFKKELSNFEIQFGKLEGKAIRYVEALSRNGYRSVWLHPRTVRLAVKAYHLNRHYIKFLRHLLKTSQAAKNAVVRTLINHIKNETEYFIGIIASLNIISDDKTHKYA